MSKLLQLQKQHPKFTYDDYRWSIVEDTLTCTFTYTIDSTYIFEHILTFPEVTHQQINHISPEEFKNLVFHLGLVEMFNYWKTTCSPIIEIKAGYLDEEQIQWWHSLLIEGMGEFFYVNDIDFSTPNFVTIISNHKHKDVALASNSTTVHIPSVVKTVLIPIGGGKDSIVTIELLKKLQSTNEIDVATLLINPSTAALAVKRQSNISKHIFVYRKLDAQVYQNIHIDLFKGHVPISSVFAFISLFVARIHSLDSIALSNESSSNEGNVHFHGKTINHQFSKTFEFESSFQRYVSTFLNQSKTAVYPYYFSYMRPLYELQIGALFAQMKTYHTTFRSCNRGQKTNAWCCNCPKCLFAYIILYPFLPLSEMLAIFGQDLLDKTDLQETALELVGRGKNKPLECVGMYEESIAAFFLAHQKLNATEKELPALLSFMKATILDKESDLEQRTTRILTKWNTEHTIPINVLRPLEEAFQKLKNNYE